MNKSANKYRHKFWTGFAMGTITATIFSHFLANKEHRGSLKKLLDYLDEAGDSIHDQNHLMYLAQTYITSPRNGFLI